MLGGGGGVISTTHVNYEFKKIKKKDRVEMFEN